MAWCFSTRPSVATVLTTHPCVSWCLRARPWWTCQWHRNELVSNLSSTVFYASAFRCRRHFVFGLCVHLSVRSSIRRKPKIPSVHLYMGPSVHLTNHHSGETDEANCSWLHPVWPPPKRPDRDSTFCVVSRASTDLIFCIHRDFDVRNNVYKPRRLVCECCRDIGTWKSRVMKPTELRDPGRMKPTEYRDEANWFSNRTDEANCW